jgi:outer membrane lipoprotein-sorting protein
MRRLACFTLLSVLTLPAQQFPDAPALIRRSADALKGYSSTEFSTEMSTEMGGSGIPMNFRMTMRFQMKQGKSSMETSSPLTGTLSVLVTDGQNIWNYSPRDKHYTKVPQGDSVEAGMPVGAGLGLRGIDSGAKVVRSETIEIDGRPHDCWVTESHTAELPEAATSAVHMHDVVQTVWFDKDLGMVLQTIMTAKVQTSPSTAATTTKTTTTIHGIRINPPLDDSLFVFTPPPDATETTEAFRCRARGPIRKHPERPRPLFRILSR